MIIIWGFKTYVRLLGILTAACGHCGNPAAQRLEQVVRKFTFFWIPLFPISSKHYLTCAFCGVTNEIPKDQVEGLMQYAVVPGAPSAPAGGQPAPQPIAGTPYAQQGYPTQHGYPNQQPGSWPHS